MPVLELETRILAPVERCFDLARSIDFHVVAAAKNQETAVRGRNTGLIVAGETVTWRARHLGVWRELTVELTAFNCPSHFRDVMTKGAFASMQHDHYFEEQHGGTVMMDRFVYKAPLGPLGVLAQRLFLTEYMRRFLEDRALLLKSAAESDEWRRYLLARRD